MTTTEWQRTPQMRVVIGFVHWYRKMYDVTPTQGFKPEPSCFHNGEFRNLLYAQLVTTPEFTSGWLELRNPEIVEGVIAEIAKNRFYHGGSQHA